MPCLWAVFLGVNDSSSSNAAASSPDIISPGPKDNRDAAGFFLISPARLPPGRDGRCPLPLGPKSTSRIGLGSLPPSVPEVSCDCSSSKAILWRKADFLKGLDRTFEAVNGFSRRRCQLCDLYQQRTQGEDRKDVRSAVALGSTDAAGVVVSSSSSLTWILRALRFPPKEDMAQARLLQF